MSNCITENRAGMIILDKDFLDNATDDELAEVFKNFFVSSCKRYIKTGILAVPEHLRGIDDAIVARGYSPCFEILEEGDLGKFVPIYDIEVLRGNHE